MGETLRAIAGRWMAFVRHAENFWLDVCELSASKTVLNKRIKAQSAIFHPIVIDTSSDAMEERQPSITP
jgi:hypothetical protein